MSVRIVISLSSLADGVTAMEFAGPQFHLCSLSRKRACAEISRRYECDVAQAVDVFRRTYWNSEDAIGSCSIMMPPNNTSL